MTHKQFGRAMNGMLEYCEARGKNDVNVRYLLRALLDEHHRLYQQVRSQDEAEAHKNTSLKTQKPSGPGGQDAESGTDEK